VAFGSGIISLHAKAAVLPSADATIIKLTGEMGHSSEALGAEAWILSVVLIALVLIARRTKHHD
jgi:hypothetical protein